MVLSTPAPASADHSAAEAKNPGYSFFSLKAGELRQHQARQKREQDKQQRLAMWQQHQMLANVRSRAMAAAAREAAKRRWQQQQLGVNANKHQGYKPPPPPPPNLMLHPSQLSTAGAVSASLAQAVQRLEAAEAALRARAQSFPRPQHRRAPPPPPPPPPPHQGVIGGNSLGSAGTVHQASGSRDVVPMPPQPPRAAAAADFAAHAPAIAPRRPPAPAPPGGGAYAVPSPRVAAAMAAATAAHSGTPADVAGAAPVASSAQGRVHTPLVAPFANPSAPPAHRPAPTAPPPQQGGITAVARPPAQHRSSGGSSSSPRNSPRSNGRALGTRPGLPSYLYVQPGAGLIDPPPPAGVAGAGCGSQGGGRGGAAAAAAAPSSARYHSQEHRPPPPPPPPRPGNGGSLSARSPRSSSAAAASEGAAHTRPGNGRSGAPREMDASSVGGPLPLKYQLLESALSHFDTSGSGRIDADLATEGASHFHVAPGRVHAAAQRCADGVGQVDYSQLARYLAESDVGHVMQHPHASNAPTQAWAKGTTTPRSTSAGAVAPAETPRPPGAPLELYTMDPSSPREIPARSAAAAAVAAADNARNPFYCRSHVPKPQEMLAGD